MTYKKRKRLGSPVSISDSINDLLKHVMPQRGKFLRIVEMWRDTFGEEVFLHARPTCLRHGVLYVTISDPVWQSDLRYRDRDFIEKVNSILPPNEKLEKIHYRVGYLEGVRPEEDVRRKEIEDTRVCMENLSVDMREAVEKVQDESLKSILAKIGVNIGKTGNKK